MKQFPKLLGIIVLLTVIGFSLAACKDAGPVLTIVNNTGYRVDIVQISPITDSTWGSDWLGYSYLYNGSSMSFTLSKNGTYDIRLIDLDYYTYVKWDVPVNGNKTVTFTPFDGHGWLSVHYENKK